MKQHALNGYHEQIAAAIRTTLALLDDAQTAKKAERVPAVLSDALALDATRRHKRKASSSEESRKYYPAATRKQRKQSAALLAKVSTDTPTDAGRLLGKRVGSFVRRGYLLKVDGGYLRTAKAFTP